MAIKQTPEDFKVEEALTDQFRQAIRRTRAPFVLYRLTKRGLTTPEAVTLAAEAIGRPAEDFSFAGLKDKYATTIQHLAVKAGANVPRPVAGKHWRIDPAGWIDKPLTGSAIAGNRFWIVIRDLDQQACELMDGAAGLLSHGAPRGRGVPPLPNSTGGTSLRDETPATQRLRLVNYFGRQRFSTLRHGKGFLARRLIAGDFEEALKLAIAAPAKQDPPADRAFKQELNRTWGQWRTALRACRGGPALPALQVLARGGDFLHAFTALPYFIQQINVEAYQSYLWNAAASMLVKQTCPPGRVWEADDPLGLMCFVAAEAIPPALAELELPLLGPQTVPRPPWDQAVAAVLKHEGLGMSDLRIPGLRKPFFGEFPRRLFIDVERFEMAPPTPDQTPGRYTRRLSFQLPRGAYATVLLAALGQ